MIQAIALDDEPLALNVIEKFCLKSGLISLKKTFTKSAEAILFLNEEKVDLLFLDINMPSISGVDLYQKIKQKPPVIFTTAHSEYAVEGFNLDAVDFLLKPFTYKRFEQAISKFNTSVQAKNRTLSTNFITIRADYSLVKIVLNEIIYIESLDNYVKIYLQNSKPILTRLTLKNIVDQLPDDKFMRIHRSYVVPLKNIKSIRHKTLFFDNIELPIGANYEKTVYAVLQSNI